MAGEETGAGKGKKKRRNGPTEKLPDVSRVEVEEVRRSSASPSGVHEIISMYKLT